MVVLLSPNNGKIRTVAKGIRKTKSRFGGRFEPFTHVDLVLYEGRNLDTITQVAVLEPFPRLRNDLDSVIAAGTMVEAADAVAQEDESSMRLFLLLHRGLRALEAGASRPGPDHQLSPEAGRRGRGRPCRCHGAPRVAGQTTCTASPSEAVASSATIAASRASVRLRDGITVYLAALAERRVRAVCRRPTPASPARRWGSPAVSSSITSIASCRRWRCWIDVSTCRAIDPERIPRHVGLILDGNGRWANARGLPRTAGHLAGEAALFDTVEGALEIGIEWVTAYTFSTENWSRSDEEVEFLMWFNEDLLLRRRDDLDAQGVRMRFAGDMDDPRIPDRNRKHMAEAVRDDLWQHRSPTGLCLQLREPEGNRRRGAHSGVQRSPSGDLSMPMTSTSSDGVGRLYIPEMPPVDLVIRSSGEHRLSNFLLWQAAYAEFYFPGILWPDFNQERSGRRGCRLSGPGATLRRRRRQGARLT